MKTRDGFLLRKVSEAYVVVAAGEAAKSFNGMIILNDTGAFLWEKLAEGCDGKEALVEALLAEYEVDKAIAERDVDAFVEKIVEAGILED